MQTKIKVQFQRLRLSLLSVLLSSAFVANTQAAEDELFFAEFPIVASVSRLPQKLSEAPGAVTVIDREMIRASGYRTVEDLLRLVPGFQVTSHNQDPAVVAYHGLTGGLVSEESTPRVQVLIDGRSQYSPLFKSGVNWNLLPVVLENIERIEVIRGTNTVAYGSNAALGVINIITQDSSQTKGWMVAANHGNNSIRDETLRWGGKVGEADLRFTMHQLGDDGFQKGNFKNFPLNQSSWWWDMPDSRHSRVIDLRGDLALSNRDELQFSLSQASDVSQFGRPNVNLTPGFEDSQKLPLWFQYSSSSSLSLLWRHVESAEEEFKLRYSFTQDRSSGAYNSLLRFSLYSTGNNSLYYPNVVDSRGVSNLHELEFSHILPVSNQSRLMWGVSAKSIALSSLAQFNSSEWKHRSNARVFGNLEYRPEPDWLFNVGASLEQDSLSGLQFDPRAAVSYHLTPEQTLRVIASRAHRTPSLYEARGYTEKWAPDPTTSLLAKNIEYMGQGVDPEQIDSLEIGYLGEFKKIRSSIDIRAFHERIPNRIQIVPLALPASNPDQSDNDSDRNNRLNNNNTIYPFGRADGAANIERVVISGYEYQLRWQPFDGTQLVFNSATVCIAADLTNTALVAENSGPTTDKITRTRDSAPTHSKSAMLMQKLPYELQASVLYYKTGPIRWRRNAEVPNATSERFDWRLAKPFKIGSTRAELAYTVQMANGSQEGRQVFRIADKLQWLSLRLEF